MKRPPRILTPRAAAAPLLAPVRFVVLVEPATKKNGGTIIMRGGKRIRSNSDAYNAFEARAVPQLRSQWTVAASAQGRERGTDGRVIPIDGPVNVCARFFLAGDWKSDVHGYYQALADVLAVGVKGRGAGIIADDNRRILQSWDGSRVYVDRARPRVEILIEPISPAVAG